MHQGKSYTQKTTKAMQNTTHLSYILTKRYLSVVLPDNGSVSLSSAHNNTNAVCASKSRNTIGVDLVHALLAVGAGAESIVVEVELANVATASLRRSILFTY